VTRVRAGDGDAADKRDLAVGDVAGGVGFRAPAVGDRQRDVLAVQEEDETGWAKRA